MFAVFVGYLYQYGNHNFFQQMIPLLAALLHLVSWLYLSLIVVASLTMIFVFAQYVVDCYCVPAGQNLGSSTAFLVWIISYLPSLANLSRVQEALIARAHPVVSILKLRPSEVFNPAAYICIKRYAVLLPQNLSFLLNLLFFPMLALHDVIRIVWVGRGHPTDTNPQKFILVRKKTLVNALTWLQTFNPL